MARRCDQNSRLANAQDLLETHGFGDQLPNIQAAIEASDSTGVETAIKQARRAAALALHPDRNPYIDQTENTLGAINSAIDTVNQAAIKTINRHKQMAAKMAEAQTAHTAQQAPKTKAKAPDTNAQASRKQQRDPYADFDYRPDPDHQDFTNDFQDNPFTYTTPYSDYFDSPWPAEASYQSPQPQQEEAIQAIHLEGSKFLVSFPFNGLRVTMIVDLNNFSTVAANEEEVYNTFDMAG